MSDKFSDANLAYRLREVVRKIVLDVLQTERPRPRYATVTAVGTATNREVTVKFPEEDVTFVVKAGALKPSVGATVRLNGPNGSRYIEDVLTGTVTFW